jgi:hypothetical protein
MPNPECANAFPAKLKCPHVFTDVPLGAYCGIVGSTEVPTGCTYPQGVCTCANTPYCGGAMPTYLQQAGMKWTCRPPRKPDDCPDVASNGKACTTDGKQCAYGSCGATTRCKCTNGKFKCATQHWAPPP